MWAMIPMFRILSSDVCAVIVSFFVSSSVAMNPPKPACRLPAVVCERLVGLRHLVRVLAPLHRGALIVARIHDLGRELLPHRAARPLPGVRHEPPHAERHPALRPHLE